MHTILLILYCSVMIEYNNPIRFDLDNLDIKIDTVYCKQNQYSEFLLKELGKNAYETVANMWNPKNAANRLLEFCKSRSMDAFLEGPCSKEIPVRENKMYRKLTEK